ncbi:hypothetical protein ABHI18_002666 [Aspergillus niger]
MNIKRESFKESLSKAFTNREAPTTSPFAMTPPSSTATSDAWSAFGSKAQKKRPAVVSPRLATRDAKRTTTTTTTTTNPTIPAHLLANLKVLVQQLESTTTAAAADAEATICTEDVLFERNPEQKYADFIARDNLPWVDTALNIIKQGEKVYDKNIKAFQDITDKLMALGEQVQEIRTEMDAMSLKLSQLNVDCLDLNAEVFNIPTQEVREITRLSLKALLEANAGDVDGCATVKKELEEKDAEQMMGPLGWY